MRAFIGQFDRISLGIFLLGAAIGVVWLVALDLGVLLAGLALLVALVWLTLRLVVSRPAVAGADPVTDAALRRASAHRVLRGATAGATLTLGPVLYVASSAVRGVAGEAAWLQALAVLLVVLALVVSLAGLALLLLPAPRVPAPAQAPEAVPA